MVGCSESGKLEFYGSSFRDDIVYVQFQEQVEVGGGVEEVGW